MNRLYTLVVFCICLWAGATLFAAIVDWYEEYRLHLECPATFVDDPNCAGNGWYVVPK